MLILPVRGTVEIDDTSVQIINMRNIVERIFSMIFVSKVHRHSQSIITCHYWFLFRPSVIIKVL